MRSMSNALIAARSWNPPSEPSNRPVSMNRCRTRSIPSLADAEVVGARHAVPSRATDNLALREQRSLYSLKAPFTSIQNG